jgi:hypothetical protein
MIGTPNMSPLEEPWSLPALTETRKCFGTEIIRLKKYFETENKKDREVENYTEV